MSDEASDRRQEMEDGTIVFANWQPIRDAIEAAYKELDRERPRNIPRDEWNLVGLAIEAYAHQQRPSCIECKRKLWQHETIRCLDCKAPLCEGCAPKHFWPNGDRRAALSHNGTRQER